MYNLSPWQVCVRRHHWRLPEGYEGGRLHRWLGDPQGHPQHRQQEQVHRQAAAVQVRWTFCSRLSMLIQIWLRLFGVVYHNGREATKGHYVADVYHTGNRNTKLISHVRAYISYVFNHWMSNVHYAQSLITSFHTFFSQATPVGSIVMTVLSNQLQNN